MGRKSFCMFFRGIELAIEVFGMSSSILLYNNNNNTTMNIDIQKAKHALATLQEEKRAQQHRLQLAAQAKQKLDNNRTVTSLRSVGLAMLNKSLLSEVEVHFTL